MLQTRKSETEAPGRQFFVTVSCSTYFEDSTAPLHEACYILALTPLNVAPQTGDLSPAAAETDEVQQLRRAAKQSLPVSATEDHPQERTCAVDPVAVLLHSAVFNFDFPIICMSKDGRTTARNRAMDELLANVAHGTDIAMAGDTPQWGTSSATQADRDVYVEWLFAHFKLWDPAFEHQLPDSAYPLYRAAIVGERFTHARFGAFTVDGEQHTYECEGWPLYSDEAQGEFVSTIFHSESTQRCVLTRPNDPCTPQITGRWYACPQGRHALTRQGPTRDVPRKHSSSQHRGRTESYRRPNETILAKRLRRIVGHGLDRARRRVLGMVQQEMVRVHRYDHR